MGMGHYERLLIQHLGQQGAKSAEQWDVSITFDGRSPATLLNNLTLAQFL